jgi:Right handed beta helix region
MRFFRASFAALALLFALTVAAAGQASAQNYYVSTSGSDSSGNGSQSNPWATISHAAGQVGPGAVVHVQAGSYSGSISTSASGSSSAYITYEGDNSNWQPVNCARIAADHGDLTQCPRLLGSWDNSGDYVRIQGFDVKGSSINAIYTQGNATIIAWNHVHDTLTSTCNSTGGSGINLNGTNAQVTDNYVHNIGPYPSSCGYVQGIYFLQAGGFAYNNISFDNSGFGIQLWHYPSSIALVNNTLFNNASGGIVLGTDNSGVTVDYITVENNIVVNNGGVGISEQGCCSTSTGIHNIYENNLVYGNSGGAYSLQNGLTAIGTVDSSPDFVNDRGDQSGDYHVQSGSPAIGAALSGNSPSADFDGNARPQNYSYDIGSYEYMGNAPSSSGSSPSAPFSMAASPVLASVSPGQDAAITITMAPRNGFNGKVDLACSGLPSNLTCTFNPSAVIFTGAGSLLTTVTVSEAATSADLHHNSIPFFPEGLTFAGALFFLGFKKRRSLLLSLMLMAGVVGVTQLSGCGGSSSSNNNNSQYTMTVTGRSGAAVQTLPVSITVNQQAPAQSNP